jgi:iron complex outermembrane receptor protein
MVSLSYGDDHYNTYLTYTKGYRPGGYNYRNSTATLVPYETETTQSYELGYKHNFKNGWNMRHAIFYNDISNLRTLVFDNTLATQTKNAQSAHSYGLESSLNYLSDSMNLYGSFGWTKAKFDTFVSDGIDYSGNYLLEVPDITAALGGSYFFAPHWYLNGSLTYIGERYYDIANSKKEEGYTTCNGGIGYKRNHWNAELYVTNLFGSENVDFMIHTPSHDYYHFAPPRVFGFKADYLF